MECHAPPAIIVFARLPVPGQVKTRLAAKLGAEAAAQFYDACAVSCFRELQRCEELQVLLYYSSRDKEEDIQLWSRSHGLNFSCHKQSPSADLGDKMYSAMAAAGSSKVVIVGTDVPDLNASHVLTAVEALDTFQVVLGPAVDGGYYLLGLTCVDKRLFEGVPWSTATVLQDTLAIAAAAGLTVAPLDTLPQLMDIDTIEDLKEWADLEQKRASSGTASLHPLYGCVRDLVAKHSGQEANAC